MPLNAKQIVQEARKVGLIGGAASSHWPDEAFDYAPKVKLPAEVGLAPIPKTDRRSRAYRHRPKQPRKWLTKAEAIAKGYSL